jgi:hypothetical protein
MGFVNTTHDFLLTQSYLLTAARTLPCVATVTLPHRTKTSQKGDDNDLCRRMDDKTDSAKMTFEAIGVAEAQFAVATGVGDSIKLASHWKLKSFAL